MTFDDALHGQGRDMFLFLFGDLSRLQRWGRMTEIDFRGKKAVIYARVSTDEQTMPVIKQVSYKEDDENGWI